MSWNDDTDTYMLEYAGTQTMKGWWFVDPAGDGDDNLFLPESQIVILEQRGEEAGDIWEIEIPNWLAKAKELI